MGRDLVVGDRVRVSLMVFSSIRQKAKAGMRKNSSAINWSPYLFTVAESFGGVPQNAADGLVVRAKLRL